MTSDTATRPAYAYEVRLVSCPKDTAAVRPGEPLGRLVAPGIVPARAEALRRYEALLAPWQGMAIRRLYFAADGLTVLRRGRWYYHPRALEELGPKYTTL